MSEEKKKKQPDTEEQHPPKRPHPEKPETGSKAPHPDTVPAPVGDDGPGG